MQLLKRDPIPVKNTTRIYSIVGKEHAIPMVVRSSILSVSTAKQLSPSMHANRGCLQAGYYASSLLKSGAPAKQADRFFLLFAFR
jgi:hypothetical protein